jgi:hypothetical protein
MKMWPWSKIRELQDGLNLARKMLSDANASSKRWEGYYWEGYYRVAAEPNPDAWRTVVLDEESAEYLKGFRSITVLGRDLAYVVNSLIDDKRIEDARLEFDAKVAASIERLADAKAKSPRRRAHERD